jgi:hypothetical protein
MSSHPARRRAQAQPSPSILSLPRRRGGGPQLSMAEPAETPAEQPAEQAAPAAPATGKRKGVVKWFNATKVRGPEGPARRRAPPERVDLRARWPPAQSGAPDAMAAA